MPVQPSVMPTVTRVVSGLRQADLILTCNRLVLVVRISRKMLLRWLTLVLLTRMPVKPSQLLVSLSTSWTDSSSLAVPRLPRPMPLQTAISVVRHSLLAASSSSMPVSTTTWASWRRACLSRRCSRLTMLPATASLIIISMLCSSPLGVITMQKTRL